MTSREAALGWASCRDSGEASGGPASGVGSRARHRCRRRRMVLGLELRRLALAGDYELANPGAKRSIWPRSPRSFLGRPFGRDSRPTECARRAGGGWGRGSTARVRRTAARRLARASAARRPRSPRTFRRDGPCPPRGRPAPPRAQARQRVVDLEDAGLREARARRGRLGAHRPRSPAAARGDVEEDRRLRQIRQRPDRPPDFDGAAERLEVSRMATVISSGAARHRPAARVREGEHHPRRPPCPAPGGRSRARRCPRPRASVLRARAATRAPARPAVRPRRPKWAASSGARADGAGRAALGGRSDSLAKSPDDER